MGDWARGEFAAAGMTGVKDFGCMIGLNEDKPVVSTDGDVFVFPKLNDPAKEAAQKRLAAILISPTIQVAFNNFKGSMPVRADVDMATANLHAEGTKSRRRSGQDRYGRPALHHRRYHQRDKLADLAILVRRQDDRQPAKAKFVEILKSSG